MIKRSLWLTASLPMLAAARNCTVHPFSGDEAVGWQPGGCYRGTWNIVSTCLSTIIACTWSIQHLNIPATDDSGWKKNKRKMKWMIITVFFPELVLIHALFEFYMAWKALQIMGNGQISVQWPWWSQISSLSWLPSRHWHLDPKHKDVESGYVENSESEIGNDNNKAVLSETIIIGDKHKLAEVSTDVPAASSAAAERENTDKSQPGAQSTRLKWTLTHCYFANMGGFMYTVEGERFLVTAQQLAEAGHSSYVYPEIKEEDIKDKSKQDWLAKLFAALQISQLIFSIITRHVQGVHFSQLETVTLSFAICGVLIYCTYFYKPQKVERANEVKLDNMQEAAAKRTADWLYSLQSDISYDGLWAVMLNKRTIRQKIENPKSRKAPRVPNDNIPTYKGNDIHPAVYVLALASGLFGAIHAIAWEFEFPTEVEKLLWKIATCISAASPVVGLLAIPFAQFTKATGDPELFAVNCLRLMQEYSWHVPSDIFRINKAIKEFEDAIAKGKSKKYSEIFSTGETGEDNKLVLCLQKFLSLEGDFKSLRKKGSLELHDDEPFIQHFHRLVDCVIGGSTKKIDDAARIDAWPRQSLLPRGVNQSILYLTGFLYCASRLIIVGVSFSSLRKMPGSVYFATNWTEYMPTFGAMGG